MISLEDGKRLVELARSSVLSSFSGGKLMLDPALKEAFSEKQGVFVTLTEKNDLRGCIGFPEPVLPLWKAIAEAAKSAAFKDPRFPPVKEDELKEIRFELSILTVPKKIDANPENVIIGKHGLIIKQGFHSGLLLPQVFTDYKCSPELALEMVCQKAGLPATAWKEPDTEILKFQAQVFSEENYGIVERK